MKLFDTIRKEKSSELSKVIPICGDITSEELGISENDQVIDIYTWILKLQFQF